MFFDGRRGGGTSYRLLPKKPDFKSSLSDAAGQNYPNNLI